MTFWYPVDQIGSCPLAELHVKWLLLPLLLLPGGTGRSGQRGAGAAAAA